MTSASAIDPATLRAYQETEYRVCGDTPLVLRVGVMCPELALLQEGWINPCCAFITACNPLGDLLEAPLNAERQRALAAELARLGFKTIAAIGHHPDGRWPAEPSFLVPALMREPAMKLGEQFQQNALVWVGADAVPELILLR